MEAGNSLEMRMQGIRIVMVICDAFLTAKIRLWTVYPA